MYIVTKFYEATYTLGQTWAVETLEQARDLCFEWVMDEWEAREDIDLSGDTRTQREIQEEIADKNNYLFDHIDEPGKAVCFIIKEVDYNVVLTN